LLILLAGSSAVAAQAQAPEWPSRPLTMVVPFAAGGPVDVLGRMLAQYLGEVVGRQVVVENVTGAGGMTGSLRVAQGNPMAMLSCWLDRNACAQPDALPAAALQCGGRFLRRSRSLRCAAGVDYAQDLPVRDLGEFISYAKARQSTMQFGSAGAGTSTHIGLCAVEPGHRGRHHPRPLSGRRTRDGGPDRRPHRLYVQRSLDRRAASRNAQVKALATLSRERSP